jgi:S-ribosylhomocysteine lyase
MVRSEHKVKHVQLESFSLDHTKLTAPYIRHAKTIPVPNSDYQINVYDLRLKTPNTELLTPKTTHSLEHLLATAIRGVLEEKKPMCKVLDLSPMGCRTGFYISVLAPRDTLSLSEMAETATEIIPAALEITELPGATIETCGAYLEHDFKQARTELQRLEKKRIVPLENPPHLN